MPSDWTLRINRIKYFTAFCAIIDILKLNPCLVRGIFMLNNLSIGTDIEENSRFSNKSLEKDRKFLERIFTAQEIEYCFSNTNPSPHLCARFCAKEAITKALEEFQIKDVYYSDIEILKHETGAPYVIIKKYPNLDIKLSMSHCKNYSTATAIISNK